MTLGEPGADRGEDLPAFGGTASGGEVGRVAAGGAELEPAGSLVARDGERALVRLFGLRRTVAGDVDLGLQPPLLGLIRALVGGVGTLACFVERALCVLEAAGAEEGAGVDDAVVR